MTHQISAEKAREYNIFFLCLVVERYEERFSQNGARILNYLIRDRSGVSVEEAFALIADAISDGALIVDKDNDKRLQLSKERFIALRDAYHEFLPHIQSQVVSEKWTFAQPLRDQLTAEEQRALDKNLRLGRIKEMKQESVSVNANAEKSLSGCFESVLRHSCSPTNLSDPTDEMRAKLMQTMSEPLKDIAQLYPDADFLFLVEKNGNRLIPKFKVIQRSARSIKLDWSET